MPFLWSHNSSGKVTRTLHSHPHCQQSQNLCKISTFWIWGATSIPRWCIAASEAESSHISTVFCPIRNAVSEGGQLSKKSICHKAKEMHSVTPPRTQSSFDPLYNHPAPRSWPMTRWWFQLSTICVFPSTMVITRSWSTVVEAEYNLRVLIVVLEYKCVNNTFLNLEYNLRVLITHFWTATKATNPNCGHQRKSCHHKSDQSKVIWGRVGVVQQYKNFEWGCVINIRNIWLLQQNTHSRCPHQGNRGILYCYYILLIINE